MKTNLKKQNPEWDENVHRDILRLTEDNLILRKQIEKLKMENAELKEKLEKELAHSERLEDDYNKLWRRERKLDDQGGGFVVAFNAIIERSY